MAREWLTWKCFLKKFDKLYQRSKINDCFINIIFESRLAMLQWVFCSGYISMLA